jgi:hypothetical protein
VRGGARHAGLRRPFPASPHGDAILSPCTDSTACPEARIFF